MNLTYCENCGQGWSGQSHTCTGGTGGAMGGGGSVTVPYFTESPVMPPELPVKCDICGTTVTDHTQIICQLNQDRNR